MNQIAGIAVVALVNAFKEIGETFLDGDKNDDLTDILDALLGLFGLGTDDCDKEEEKEG